MNQFRNDMMGLLNGTEDKLSKEPLLVEGWGSCWIFSSLNP